MASHDSYYDPPDYGEGEAEVDETVYCKNEECSEFEKDVEWSGTAVWYGTGWTRYCITIDYLCPTCNEESMHEFERESDYYGE